MNTQLIVSVIVVAILLFVAGFLLGEWLHGLGGNLFDAIAAAWHRFLNLFSRDQVLGGDSLLGRAGVPLPASAGRPGITVNPDGNCHDGWSAFPGDTFASRCIEIGPDEVIS